VAGAVGDVLLNYLDALENCQEYTSEQAIDDFAKSFVIELLVSDTFDYAPSVPADQKGLDKSDCIELILFLIFLHLLVLQRDFEKSV